MRCCKLGSCIDASAGPFFRECSQLGLDQGDIGLGVEVVLAEGSMRRTCCPSAAEKCGWGATHSPWNAISVWCPMTSGTRLYACLPEIGRASCRERVCQYV